MSADADGIDWAIDAAKQIVSKDYANMGVTYSPDGEYIASQDVLLPLSIPTTTGKPKMLGVIPPWLATAIGLIGTLEAPGSSDNPVIVAWGKEIARH